MRLLNDNTKNRPHTLPLVIQDLKKRFGPLPVLGGISVSFQSGESTAVVGPNGAGKTTLIKSVLGLVRPDDGDIRVQGRSIFESVDYRSAIGYMPQSPNYPENLSGRDILNLIREVHGRGPEPDRSLERILDLGSELDKPFRTLSGGTRQKISALAAFMYRPPILILDEPTAGLDPIASTALKDRIARASAEGTTVILTSHVMSDLEELCDRILFLLDGRIRFDGSLEEIRSRTGEHRLERAIARLLDHRAA